MLSKDVALTLIHETGHHLGLNHLNLIFEELETNKLPWNLRQKLGCGVNFMSYNNPTKEEFENSLLGVNMSNMQRNEVLKRLNGKEIPSYERTLRDETYHVPKYLDNTTLEEYICK